MSEFTTMLEDAEIPGQVFINGVPHQVIDKMNNHHYRALLLPHGGGTPIWVSNTFLRSLIEQPA